MNNSKRGFILVVILSVILIMLIIAGVIKERHDNKLSEEEYVSCNEMYEKKALEENVPEESTKDPSKIIGLANKLKGKQDVNVLILGDDIAMSTGRKSEAGIWSDALKNLLESTYGSKVNLKLVAKEGATTEMGLSDIKENDISDYDLVILCYGSNDRKEARKLSDVKKNYIEIIRQIKQKSPTSLVIAVLESSLELNNSYRLAVLDVAANNYMLVADMRNAFDSSGKSEASISNNGLPNDAGYEIYTQTIAKKIKEVVG